MDSSRSSPLETRTSCKNTASGNWRTGGRSIFTRARIYRVGLASRQFDFEFTCFVCAKTRNLLWGMVAALVWGLISAYNSRRVLIEFWLIVSELISFVAVRRVVNSKKTQYCFSVMFDSHTSYRCVSLWSISVVCCFLATRVTVSYWPPRPEPKLYLFTR